MASLTTLIKKISSKNNQISNVDLYNEIFHYYTSSDVLDDYEQALRQLDKTSLSNTDNWLLFRLFHMTTDRFYYTNEQRNKLCQFWLPTYESLFEQLLPEKKSLHIEDCIEHERLVVIKYLVMNMIEMQKISTSIQHVFKEELQFENFIQKNEYFRIIQLILPILNNSDIIQRLEKDNFTTIKFECHSNDLSNTFNTKTSFVVWIILKLTMIFIKTDTDCFTIAKHNQMIKHILFSSMKKIKTNDAIKLSFYVLVGLLFNEDDIKNEIDKPLEIIKTLMMNIKQIINSKVENNNFSNYGIHILDMLLALKAYLQHDQIKRGFITNDGLQSLIDIIDNYSQDSSNFSEHKEIKLNEDDKYQKTFEQIQSDFHNDTLEMRTNIELLVYECLFVMSFNNDAVNLLKTNEKFMSHIRNLANKQIESSISKNEFLKKTLDGLLWRLEREEEFKQTNDDETNEFDLMISYSWSDKSLVHDIYKHLTKDYHLKIWLDENQMAGSLCQTMARAVDKSTSILMCMSETYKRSENCRNEVEYARDRKKLIIPIIVKDVERDGWFDFISTGTMCIDFVQQDFSEAIGLLIAEIQSNISEPIEAKEKHLSLSIPMRQSITASTYKNLPMESWSDQHVRTFLYDNKLDAMIGLTEYMTGEDLKVLIDHCLSHENYWLIFDRLNREMEKRFQQILPISVYLRFLNQTRKYYYESSSF
ncbi:hypothetical protein I4U23_015626 [Adineta vaga]|nr:hypothetical protein I4U23_015626 [Adineta vaga]